MISINSAQVFLLLLSLCSALFTPNLSAPQQANNNNNQNSPNGYIMPPKWSSFFWNATGSWTGTGKIQNQILYPFKTLNAVCDNSIAVDVVNKQFKMNFTCGGMQKTNSSGTWLTYAPGGQCWFIERWTYDVQVLTYTYATLKNIFSNNVAMWTGNVEDVSSCATTVGVTFLTDKGRVTEWDFAGGFPVAGLGSVYFDYKLTYDDIVDGVPSNADTQFWDVDQSCKNPATLSTTLCHDQWPGGCTQFLAGFKPTSGTPDCNCTNC